MLFILIILGATLNALRGSSYKYGKATHIAVFAAVSGFFVEHWFQVPLCALAMYAGQAPSWGEIVGQDGILGGNKKAHSLALQRGAYWGGLISLATWNPAPLLAGFTLGIGFELGYWAEKINSRVDGWKIGEAVYGAFLWGSLNYV